MRKGGENGRGKREAPVCACMCVTVCDCVMALVCACVDDYVTVGV